MTTKEDFSKFKKFIDEAATLRADITKALAGKKHDVIQGPGGEIHLYKRGGQAFIEFKESNGSAGWVFTVTLDPGA